MLHLYMRLINNRMACSGNLGKIALGQLKNVEIALATLRQLFYIFHLTLSNFPQIALQPMRLLVLINPLINRCEKLKMLSKGLPYGVLP